eukprot:2548480-Rhodomonas_salina.1
MSSRVTWLHAEPVNMATSSSSSTSRVVLVGGPSMRASIHQSASVRPGSGREYWTAGERPNGHMPHALRVSLRGIESTELAVSKSVLVISRALGSPALGFAPAPAPP